MTPTDLRERLLASVEQNVTASSVAVLLSGGVDSLSVGFCAEEVGLDVHAYTFKMEGIENADVRAAKKATSVFDWPHTIAEVPTDLETLKRDFLILSERWGCDLKTDFECSWPMMYLIPKVREQAVIVGLGADRVQGLNREAAMNYRDDPVGFRRWRETTSGGAWEQLKAMVEARDRTYVAPYQTDAVREFFLAHNYKEINQPFQKHFQCRAFEERFRKFGRRDHAPYQTVARIPHYFRRLLETDLNVNNRERVMDLCHDFGKFNNLDPKRWMSDRETPQKTP